MSEIREDRFSSVKDCNNTSKSQFVNFKWAKEFKMPVKIHPFNSPSGLKVQMIENENKMDFFKSYLVMRFSSLMKQTNIKFRIENWTLIKKMC